MKRFFVILLSIIGCFVVSNVFAEEAAAKKEEQGAAYVGVTKCKMCHLKQHETWQKMKHSKAFSVLKGKEKDDIECLKCHTTGFGKGGYDPKKTAEENAKFENVQCEDCHGPGSIHAAAKLDDKKTTMAEKPTTCAECHNPHKNFKEIAEEKRKALEKENK